MNEVESMNKRDAKNDYKFKNMLEKGFQFGKKISEVEEAEQFIMVCTLLCNNYCALQFYNQFVSKF